MSDSNKPVDPKDLKKLKTRGKGAGKITSLLFISMSLVVRAKVVVVIVLRLVGSIIYFLVWSCPPSSHLITHRKQLISESNTQFQLATLWKYAGS